jgi:hypothetical protein
MKQLKIEMEMDRKKWKFWIFILTLWLLSISCKVTNPMSGLADAIKNMFESIARGISISL